MKITKRTQRQVTILIQIVSESYDREIPESSAIEALVNFGFLHFLKELPDVEFKDDYDYIDPLVLDTQEAIHVDFSLINKP